MAELRNLTEDEKFSLATDALGFGVLDSADQKLTYEIMESAVKKFCEVNGLILGVDAPDARSTYYCHECGVMEGNWHQASCSHPRSLVLRPSGEVVDHGLPATPVVDHGLVAASVVDQKPANVIHNAAGMTKAPKGYKLVPLELTPDMEKADPYGMGYGRLQAIWSRLLAAAPDAGVEALPPGAEPSPEGFGKVDLTGIKRGQVRTPAVVKRGPVRTPGVDVPDGKTK